MHRPRIRRLSPLGASLLLLAACSDSTGSVHRPAVATVSVAPLADTLLVGDTVRAVAIVRDSTDSVLTDRIVNWVSSRPSVATVSASGLVTGVGANPYAVTITATAEGVSGFAAIVIDTAYFASVEAGAYHTCGRTPAGKVNCWGFGGWGQIGNGSAGDAYTPHAVNSTLVFTAVSVGGIHSCGLTADGAAHCWGADVYGSLGAGVAGPESCTADTSGAVIPCSSVPLTVAGAHAFVSLSSGWGPTCALTADGTAYCWGDNTHGQLGIGSDTGALDVCTFGPCSYTPRAVAGGFTFTTIAAGNTHVCALTASGAAYCWGDNTTGQLGIASAPDVCDSAPCSRTLVPVAGGHTFTALNAGLFSTCGRATSGAWYCWGWNNNGQLGNGTTGPELCFGTGGTYHCSTVPVAVAGDMSFATVVPGHRHSCGVTSSGAVSCWGWNDSGQLGDGTTISSVGPVPVAGGFKVSSISPYRFHTCAVTRRGVAYCWGANDAGWLGNGTTTSSRLPVRVAGQGAMAATAAQRSSASPRFPLAPSPRLPRP